MERNAQKIAEQIKNLVDELAVLSGVTPAKKQSAKKRDGTSVPKGAIGALTLLTEDGFFDKPQNIASIMEKLKEIGRYYPQTSISMNLLNLTKRRVFNRLKNKDTKNWEYVLRK
ncbi:MAG TPA: hypothetical protein VMW41_02020 [Candidatus Bathyarchaeia archaeon]|nr:hypothetical protein [Candidatus Bathyarchaeia archaeon]